MKDPHWQWGRALGVVLLAIAALAGCATQQTGAQAPRNVIIMYADGAAATQWEFGRYSSQALRGQPYAVTDTVFKQGTMGLLATNPHEAFATDSAATASAMSTGVKTTIGAIGVDAAGKPVRTAAEAAKAAGKRIGLITTSEIWDASPAAFSVHARNRSEGPSIVEQYLALEPDVLLGGGADLFLPAPQGKRKDGKDIIAAFRAKGYAVARNAAALRATSARRLLGLFSGESLAHTIDREGDDERHETNAERLLHIEGRPRGPRILTRQLGVGGGGQRGEYESQQERQPEHTAHIPGHLPDERVNARAENIADNEAKQHPAPNHALERGFARRVG